MAHNAKIGQHCFLTGQNGLAGSASLGDYVQMGGRVAGILIAMSVIKQWSAHKPWF